MHTPQFTFYDLLIVMLILSALLLILYAKFRPAKFTYLHEPDTHNHKSDREGECRYRMVAKKRDWVPEWLFAIFAWPLDLIRHRWLPFRWIFTTPVAIAILLAITLPSLAQVPTNSVAAATINTAISNSAPAVTVTATNFGQLIGLPAGVNAGVSTFLGGLVDAAPYISNDIVNLDFGALYNKSDLHGKFGGYMALTVPTSQQSAVGVGGFFLNNQLGNGTVSLTLGTTVSNVFLLGTIYAFASSGPDYNFSKDPSTGSAYGIGAYNATGFEKNWDLGAAPPGAKPTFWQDWDIGIKFGVFNISTIAGLGEFGGFALSKHW